ncbi:alanine racemase [Leucobacter tardus]|uniref:Alanine racemase n=1 Tax=Leucobacter tardus TaxID=501483 RepID=A0A939TR61_9MICO|nr:alanine racemase [Leucobacter tardus]MBO2989697.1 alanine racemase [Leucobacter tardus]
MTETLSSSRGSSPAPFREARIDVAAIAANTQKFVDLTGVPVIAVVKADGYGHGAILAARGALAGGASHLGVADIAEAVELRSAGIDAPIIAWLHAPGETFARAREHRIEVGLSSVEQLDAAGDGAPGDEPLRVHLKVDTGLSRNGIAAREWERACVRAAELETDGRVEIVGIFSHLSNTTLDDDRAAIRRFDQALDVAAASGLRPRIRHIAASQAALELPESRYDAVRIGLGIYGFSPLPDRDGPALGLRAAMTLRGSVASVKRVGPGTGVSYDYLYRTERETTLALVPLGYADGVPRQATGRATVHIDGRTHPVVGRIAMDQFVVDIGDAPVAVGDEVVLFGEPTHGLPSAEAWADAADTIQRDVLTGVGRRVPRVAAPE